MKQILDNLKEFTKDCREDMHEPDEQGLSARIVGDHLDNAMGTTIEYQDFPFGDKSSVQRQEYVVILDKVGEGSFKINLADLIALARKSQL